MQICPNLPKYFKIQLKNDVIYNISDKIPI